MNNTKFEYLLRLADSTLILSQRLTELCGKGPALEEDMALANVALDLIGQARFWYDYAGALEGAGRTEDQLAFLRDAHEFHNFLLVEQPNGNYADTVARQFYFDSWHCLFLEQLRNSTDQEIAAIANKALKEVRYHLRRSRDLVVRLGDGTEYSHRLMQSALNDLWMFTGEMFQADALDLAMQREGVAPDLSVIHKEWMQFVSETLLEATLTLPAQNDWMQSGGKQGVHSEKLGYMLAEMQYLQRAYPGAVW